MNISEKFEEIKLENSIIYIYFILLTIYLYANTIEINYLKYQNQQDKDKYRLLLYIVFGTSLIISLYYTIESLKDLKTPNNEEMQKLNELSAIANILILIATIIILYIIYKDKDLNLEISP